MMVGVSDMICFVQPIPVAHLLIQPGKWIVFTMPL